MAFRIRRIVLNDKPRLAAMKKVYTAVKRGQLPNLKRKRIKCADCDARAVVFDHRHYAKPLKVEPVCKQHNSQRGFALDAEFTDLVTGLPATQAAYLAERSAKPKRRGECVVIAITGHHGYLRDQIERTEWRAKRSRGLRRWGREQKFDYMNAEHEYALFYGDADTGARIRLTGREAWIANQDAEATFIQELRTSRSVRMYRWRLAERISKKPYSHTRIGVWSSKWTHARFGRA